MARRKKRVVKKRFYVFCLIAALLVVLIAYFGIKALGNNDKDPAGTPNNTPTPAGINAPDGEGDSENPPEQQGGEPGEGGEGTEGEDAGASLLNNDVNYDRTVETAVLSNYYISVISQKQSYVLEEFGAITKTENWNGGIYFHKKFPSNMWVSYTGSYGDDGTPTADSICTAVAISIDKIMPEVQTFRPENWGEFELDATGTGWTDYFYNVALGSGLRMLVYCDAEGTVGADSHIMITTST